MANTNFIVQNGLTVGPLTIDAASGTITTTGGISTSSSSSSFNTINAVNLYATTIGNVNTALSGTSAAIAGTLTAATVTATTIGNTNSVMNASTLTTSGDVTVGGNLTVSGTQTVVNSTTVSVNDKNLVLANNAASASAADGAGITVNGALANITYVNSTVSWDFNKNITVTGNITPTANVTYNLGSTTAWFNNIYGVAIQAKYADLAEFYASDAIYEPGTVVDFGGSHEVTLSVSDSSPSVAGVVSTNPAYNMNSGIEAEFPVAVALTGRVPTKVVGNVYKGQMLVSAGNGYARAELNPAIGTVIGKALENFTGDQGVIEVVVGKI